MPQIPAIVVFLRRVSVRLINIDRSQQVSFLVVEADRPGPRALPRMVCLILIPAIFHEIDDGLAGLTQTITCAHHFSGGYKHIDYFDQRDTVAALIPLIHADTCRGFRRLHVLLQLC